MRRRGSRGGGAVSRWRPPFLLGASRAVLCLTPQATYFQKEIIPSPEALHGGGFFHLGSADELMSSCGGKVLVSCFLCPSPHGAPWGCLGAAEGRGRLGAHRARPRTQAGPPSAGRDPRARVRGSESRGGPSTSTQGPWHSAGSHSTSSPLLGPPSTHSAIPTPPASPVPGP